MQTSQFIQGILYLQQKPETDKVGIPQYLNGIAIYKKTSLLEAANAVNCH
jgi:hypothetical protein